MPDAATVTTPATCRSSSSIWARSAGASAAAWTRRSCASSTTASTSWVPRSPTSSSELARSAAPSTY